MYFYSSFFFFEAITAAAANATVPINVMVTPAVDAVKPVASYNL